MHAKLTKKVVDATRLPQKGKTYVWDTDLCGFGLVVVPKGRKTFVVRYGGRRSRRFVTLGQYGALTMEDARERAGQVLGSVALGKDPAGDRRAQRAMPTWREWVADYLAGVELRKKAPWVDVYHLRGHKGGNRRDAKPKPSEAMRRWGNRLIDTITTKDVEALLRFTVEHSGRIHANREHASVRACLEAAVRAGFLTDNPAARVKKLPENPPRQRVLTDEELTRVLAAADALPDPVDRALFSVLIGTGCRKSEVLGAKWEDLDLEQGVWRLPSPKAGRLQTIPLPRALVITIGALPRSGPWVFPSHRGPAKRRVEVRDLWAGILASADVSGVTLHDLRRTYGLRVAKRAGILAASRLLRHSDTRITSRVYAPLGVEDLRKVTEDEDADRGRLLGFPQPAK
jgi:integrase